MSKAARNWDRRARKLQKRARLTGRKDELLDLTPLNEGERTTFVEQKLQLSDFRVIHKDMMDSFTGIDFGVDVKTYAGIMHTMQGAMAEASANLLKVIQNGFFAAKADQISGLRSDYLVIDDWKISPEEFVNYPLPSSQPVAMNKSKKENESK
jgi:hypothetical protein